MSGVPEDYDEVTDAEADVADIVGEDPLNLADGSRGRSQLALYLGSLPFWLVVIVILPDYLAPMYFLPIGGIGLVLTLAAIWKFGVGIEERMRMGIVTFSIPYWMIVIYYAWTQMMPRGQYGTLFLGGILILYIMFQLPDPLERRDFVELGLLIGSGIIAVITSIYLYLNYQQLAIDQIGLVSDTSLFIAAIFTFVMIYLTWRSFGLTFVIVVVGGIGYGFLGPYFPGALGHGGLSTYRTLTILVVTVDGFFGFLTRLVAAWIALFLLYAGLLKAYGAFELILRLAVRTSKYVDSGVAQTAVIASAIIGSVNGSQTANAGMTGSFTIPLMMRSNVRPETAGGIESVASTSGQVLPPIMGASAFIMASLLSGVSYLDVIVAGIIPAVILVVSIVVAVHYIAAPQIKDPDMSSIVSDTLSRQTMVLESVKFGVPLIVLLYALGVLQTTVMTAALWTVVSMIGFGILIPVSTAIIERESSAEALLHSLKQTVDGFREGTIVLAPVAIILASINGVVDILMATGVPGAISLTLIDLSGGIMIVAVFLAALICILLGLGMPTTAAYTIVALLIAPTLINQFLVPDIAAHFFVFYAAILSGLTPPIATCVAVTCGIAGGGFWRTCFDALKISAPLYVLPFAFIYHPELVAGEFGQANLIAGMFAMIGALAIIHGINYQFSFSRTPTLGFRVGYFVIGVVVMVHPATVIQLGGIGALAGLFIVQSVVGGMNVFGVVGNRISQIGKRL